MLMNKTDKVKVKDLKGEIWKRYEDTNYYFSNMGRAKKIYKSGKERLLHPYRVVPKKGSWRYVIKINGKENTFAPIIYRLFNGVIPDDHVVIHRNKVLSDNSAINLKTMPRTMLGTLYGGRTSKRKLVYCFDNKKIYKGTREAAKDLNINRQSICDYCNRKVKKPLYRLKWLEE